MYSDSTTPVNNDENRELHGGRAFDRLVNFSDAIVAVVITVLVLPLADLAIGADESTAWDVLGDHMGQITTFFFTFFVVAYMWMLHNRIFNQLISFDIPLFWLNLFWLATIAFLPVTSALYGEGDSPGGTWDGNRLTGSGLLYWFSLAAISGLGTVMAWHVRRHRDLIDPEIARPILLTGDWRARYRGVAFAAFFILIGLVSQFAPDVARWLPLGLIPLTVVMRRGEK